MRLFNTTDYLLFPQYLIKPIEQYYVYYTCYGRGLCGHPGRIANSAAWLLIATYQFSDYVATLFYPDMCRLKDCGSSGIAFYSLFEPVGLIFSLTTIPVVANLVKKESTAFTLQLFQCISIFFQSFFACDLITSFLDYFDHYATEKSGFSTTWIISHFAFATFLNWTFFLSFCLLLDRFLSIWKPIKYKCYVSKKKAVILAIVLLIFSFALNFDEFLWWYDFTRAIERASFIMRLCRGILTLIMLLAEVVICTCFVKLFLKQSSVSNSQLKSHQNNVNFIIIGSVVIDSISMCAYASYQLTTAIQYLSNYTVSGGDLNYFQQMVNAIIPSVSLIICILFSKMYRAAFVQVYFKFCCKNSRVKKFIKKTFNLKSSQVGVINVAEAPKQTTGITDGASRN